MTNRFATFTSRMAVGLTMIFAIVACGGGGGGGGGFEGGGSGGDTDTYFLQVALKDASGNPTSIVSSASPGTLEVTVTRNGRNGPAAADVIVNASVSAGELFPSSGSKLTDTNGFVTFRIEAGDEKGAGTVEVSVTDESGNTVIENINFQLGATGLRLGSLVNGSFFDGEIAIAPGGAIAANGGQAVLSLAIVDENDVPVGSAEIVRLSSACIDRGDATLNPENSVPVSTGQVEIVYTSSGCRDSDQITAEVVGEGAQAFGTLEIADPTADALTFVSAEPGLIVLKGTGGGPDRQEQSTVTFAAVDSNGAPQEGVEVRFALSTDVGGVVLSPLSAITNEEGTAFTNVFSGDVATAVRVIGTIDSSSGSGEVSAVSDVLTITTGLPDQNSISLSVEGSFTVEEGLNTDGIVKCLTVRMADKFNNPVPDGTAAVFTTEYGSIDPSCETGRRNGDRAGSCGAAEAGSCSVAWVSQDPRGPTLTQNQQLVVDTQPGSGYSCPSHNGSSGPCPDDLGSIRGGRSTVLVSAIGEESFVDRNGNGLFDQAEADDGLWSNLTEAFLDHNENGLLDPATELCEGGSNSLTCRAGSEEIFIDFNNNGAFDANGDDPGNGYPDEGVTATYNGLLCPKEGDGVWCSRELINVRDQTVLILTGTASLDIALYQGRIPTGTTSSGNSYTAYIADIFNNAPASGSTVSVSATAPCQIDGQSSFTVPVTIQPGAFEINFSQSGEVEYDSCAGPAPSRTGTLTISVSSTGGAAPVSESYTCLARLVDTAPDPLCP